MYLSWINFFLLLLSLPFLHDARGQVKNENYKKAQKHVCTCSGDNKSKAAHTILSRKSFTLQCKMTSLPNCVVTLICADSSSKNGSWVSVVSLTFSTFASVNGDESSCHVMSYGLFVSGTMREIHKREERTSILWLLNDTQSISILQREGHIHSTLKHLLAFDNYLQSSSIWYWQCRKRQTTTSHSTLRHLSSLNILAMQNYIFLFLDILRICRTLTTSLLSDHSVHDTFYIEFYWVIKDKCLESKC